MTNSTLTVVRILGAVLLVSVLLIGGLSYTDAGRPIPDILQLLASSSLTGLLGLLAPRSDAAAARLEAGPRPQDPA